MKKTSDKILDTALELFNSRGLSQVTLRTIAGEMGISQGNLNYHFKKREDIIEALYFQLVEKLDHQLSQSAEENDMLRILMEMSDSVMHYLFDYRFILLDFAQVMRENQKIKTHFISLQKVRKQQFITFFQILINAGLMQPESLPNEHENLYHRFQILGDFWISSAEIVEKSLTKKAIGKYSEIIRQIIFPYLTQQGKKQYLAITAG